MSTSKKKISVIGKPASQLGEAPYKRGWHNAVSIERILKVGKPKAVSYLKMVYISRGGGKTNVQFWKTVSSGYMIYVDETNIRIGLVLGLTGNQGIVASNKKEFDNAFKRVMKILG